MTREHEAGSIDVLTCKASYDLSCRLFEITFRQNDFLIDHEDGRPRSRLTCQLPSACFSSCPTQRVGTYYRALSSHTVTRAS